jgi:glycosyltransferase involved in cell wall biosynthesis
MNLLIYSHAFAPSVGGIETIVMALAKGLAEASTGPDRGKLTITLVTRQPRAQFDDSSLPFSVIRRPSAWRLFELIRSADVVHLAGPALLPLLFSLVARKPVVVEHHGFQTICPNGQLIYEPEQTPCPGHFMAGRHHKCLRCNAKEGRLASCKLWLLTFPRRFFCRLAAANITPTQWLSELLQLPRAETIVHGLPPAASPVTAISPCVPSEFVFQGRFVSAKGARVLLQAASQLKAMGLDFRLKLIGDGPERASLERLAQQLHLEDRVRFLGPLPQAELETAFAGATAIVMPSLGGEVFGLVAAENMARGQLLVVSDLGALAEVVGDAGLVFRVGNADDLTAQLARVLQSPRVAEELRRRASRRSFDFFSQERMIQNHIAVYRRIQEPGGTFLADHQHE